MLRQENKAFNALLSFMAAIIYYVLHPLEENIAYSLPVFTIFCILNI